MADPIRQALESLLAAEAHIHVAGPEYQQARDAALAALAAEPPAPAPTINDIWELCEDHEFHLGDGFNDEESAEGMLQIINAALARWGNPAPAPVADHIPGARNMVPAAYAARLRQCPTHGQLPANAWACPECLRELREELARLRGSAADGEREELAQWLEDEAVYYEGLSTEASAKATRAAALLRQLPPEGLSAEEYYHIDSGARIVREPCDEGPGGCWTVRNSRHVSPCTEFRTVADAVAALRQTRRQEVGDE